MFCSAPFVTLYFLFYSLIIHRPQQVLGPLPHRQPRHLPRENPRTRRRSLGKLLANLLVTVRLSHFRS